MHLDNRSIDYYSGQRFIRKAEKNIFNGKLWKSIEIIIKSRTK